MSFQPLPILYSCVPLSMTEESTSVRKHWQVHISRDEKGQWVGWASHGEGERPHTGATLIAQDKDVWSVVEALNERMDGRCNRGYNPPDPEHIAWIDEDLRTALAQQGIDIPDAPMAGPELLPLSNAGVLEDTVSTSPPHLEM